MSYSVDSAMSKGRKHQRPSLPTRISSLLPASWTGKKSPPTSPTLLSPPLRSVLVTSGESSRRSPPLVSPTFVEPPRRRSLDGTKGRPRLPSAVVASRGFCRAPPTRRSASLPLTKIKTEEINQMETLCDEAESSTPSTPSTPSKSSTTRPPHKRSNSAPDTGVWLCSRPTGTRCERPKLVHSSSITKSPEAKEVSECISNHRVVDPPRRRTSGQTPTREQSRQDLSPTTAPRLPQSMASSAIPLRTVSAH